MEVMLMEGLKMLMKINGLEEGEDGLGWEKLGNCLALDTWIDTMS